MVNIVIGLISFVAIFGGVLIGMFAARRLPGHHLSNETQSAVNVSVAVIGTLSALVLGLMITAANRSFSARADDVRELSVQIIRMAVYPDSNAVNPVRSRPDSQLFRYRMPECVA